MNGLHHARELTTLTMTTYIMLRLLHSWVREEKDEQMQLKHMFRLALCRYPTPQELEFLQTFLHDQKRKFSNRMPGLEAKASNSALVAVARVLMNLDEFITRE